MLRSQISFFFSLALLLVVIAWPQRLAAQADSPSQSFTVTSSDDNDDGLCDSSHCSLREAISAANANTGADTIVFALGLPAPTIAISGTLPIIVDPVLIDGNSGGSQRVALDGSAASGDGLTLETSDSTVQGFVIHSFPGNGLRISGDNNSVQDSYVGTDHSGTIDLGNGSYGILISGGSHNQIGGAAVGEGNLVSGNGSAGIRIESPSASFNVIQGNRIGTTAAGDAALRNDNHGITIFDSPDTQIGGTVGITVGGPCTGACNLISGNGNGDSDSGIFIGDEEADRTLIVGNYIGSDLTGTSPIPNSRHGIFFKSYPGSGRGSPDMTQIGGSMAEARNLISGNNRSAIYGTAVGHSHQIQGNFIGTDIAGTQPLPNGQHGIYLQGSGSNDLLVGGTEGVAVGGHCSGACNLISGNGSSSSYHGLFVEDGGRRIVVQGNFVGTEITGSVAISNGGQGIRLTNIHSDALIGGDDPAAGNLISGNGTTGLYLGSNGLISVNGHRVIGNSIGTDLTGTSAIPNGGTGFDSGRCGSCLYADNLISGNGDNGMKLAHAYGLYGSTQLRVQGNLIGVAADGISPLGNGGDGIEIFGTNLVNDRTRNILIGGPERTDANLIAANGGHGIFFTNKRIRDITVQGNAIGTDLSHELALGNGGHGILSDYTIGYATGNLFEGNQIAHNGLDGVRVMGQPRQAIRMNQIYANGGLGIDLNGDGVSLNDLGDIDMAANMTQNYPELSDAATHGGATYTIATMETISNTLFTLDYFGVTGCDSSGYGEGRRYLGSGVVQSDSAGQLSHAQALPALVPAGDFVVATATDPEGNSSEFSPCLQVGTASGQLIGNVSTTVLLEGSGNPTVELYRDVSSDGSGDWYLIGVVEAASDGSYQFTQLASGDYGLRFSADGGFAPEYYDEADNWGSATLLSVTDGEITTANPATLEPGGLITGTVTTALGAGIAGIRVTALQDNDGTWQSAAQVESDLDGNYTIAALATGSYRLSFVDPAGRYNSEFYDDQSDFASATDVPVTKGATTANIDAVLADIEYSDVIGTGSCVVTIGSDGQIVIRQHRSHPSCTTTITTPPGLISCSAGITPSQVIFTVGDRDYIMGDAGGSSYTTGLITISGAWRTARTQSMTIGWDCDGTPTNINVGSFQLFDPSGFVTDGITGEPVVGATVTLYQVPSWRARSHADDVGPQRCESNESKVSGAPWSQPAPTSEGVVVPPLPTLIDPVMSQQRTDSDGHYGWYVAAGCWYVVVSAPDYETITSPVVGVPSEVTDLDLVMNRIPTSTNVAFFEAEPIERAIRLLWATISEENVAGFNLYRTADPAAVGGLPLNPTLIPAQLSGLPAGGSYEWRDGTVTPGRYYYWLELVMVDGSSELVGPTEATLTEPTAVRLATFDRSSTPRGWPLSVGLLIGVAVVLIWRRPAKDKTV